MPNGRCYLHGGRSPGGVAAGRFKTGKYSKYLPGDLLSVYDESRADPDLLSMRETIAVMDARIAQLFQQLPTATDPELWSNLVNNWGQLMDAIRRDDQKTQVQLIGRINRIINDGASISVTYREIYDLWERRRKTAETEQRVIMTGERMVAIESVLMYLAIQIEATKSAVLKYVDNAETRRKIINAAVDANRELLGASVDS